MRLLFLQYRHLWQHNLITVPSANNGLSSKQIQRNPDLDVYDHALCFLVNNVTMQYLVLALICPTDLEGVQLLPPSPLTSSSALHSHHLAYVWNPLVYPLGYEMNCQIVFLTPLFHVLDFLWHHFVIWNLFVLIPENIGKVVIILLEELVLSCLQS